MFKKNDLPHYPFIVLPTNFWTSRNCHFAAWDAQDIRKAVKLKDRLKMVKKNGPLFSHLTYSKRHLHLE